MKYLISYIWAVLWGILICVLLLLPSSNYGGIPSFYGIDKVVHVGIFFVEAILLYLGTILKSERKVNKWLAVIKVIIATSIFAVLTELGQMYLTNTRSADPWDVFADIVGVAMATFAFILLYRREK